MAVKKKDKKPELLETEVEAEAPEICLEGKVLYYKLTDNDYPNTAIVVYVPDGEGFKVERYFTGTNKILKKEPMFESAIKRVLSGELKLTKRGPKIIYPDGITIEPDDNAYAFKLDDPDYPDNAIVVCLSLIHI